MGLLRYGVVLILLNSAPFCIPDAASLVWISRVVKDHERLIGLFISLYCRF